VIPASHEQLSLDSRYAPGAAPTTTWTDELEILCDAVAYLGLKDVCFELNTNKTLLLDAMKERDRKHWQAEWTHVVIAMLARRSDEIAGDLLFSLLRARMGVVAPAYEIVANDELTPSEQAEYDRLAAKRARAARAKRTR
jgi:hypothetical protein